MHILHGDDNLKSRDRYLQLRHQLQSVSPSIIDLNGADITLADLTSAIGSTSLLGQTPGVFIIGLFSRKPGKTRDQLINWLVAHPAAQLVIWEDKDCSALLRTFPPAIVENFSLPKLAYQFLDNLSLSAYHLALTQTAPEQLLVLLAAQLRKILLVTSGRVDSLPAWQQAKLKPLIARHPHTDWLQAYLQLLALDYAQKTSSTPFSLAAALELWLGGL